MEAVQAKCGDYGLKRGFEKPQSLFVDCGYSSSSLEIELTPLYWLKWLYSVLGVWMQIHLESSFVKVRHMRYLGRFRKVKQMVADTFGEHWLPIFSLTHA